MRRTLIKKVSSLIRFAVWNNLLQTYNENFIRNEENFIGKII